MIKISKSRRRVATTQRRSDSTDASAFVGANHGQTAADAGQRYQAGGHAFDDARAVIVENKSGGAGFYAEAHHTASFNIHADAEGGGTAATRLGSTEWASADIELGSGEQYNPKFYATARESYQAGAEIVDGQAKYAGQTIIVPADQLEDVERLHREQIHQAQVAGDTERVKTLESLRFDDHIDANGAASAPLTYAEAQEGAEQMRAGELPEYAGEQLDLGEAVGEGALLAAGIALAVSAAPQLVELIRRGVTVGIDRETAARRVQEIYSSEEVRRAVTQSLGRGGGAAALAVVDGIDPVGAAFLVNALVDVASLAVKLNRGEIGLEGFREELGRQLLRRGLYTGLTATAFWLVGPLGLLAPIILKHSLRRRAELAEAVSAWAETSRAMQREMAARMRQVVVLEELVEKYRQAREGARAAADAAARFADRASVLLDEIGGQRAHVAAKGGSPE